MKNKFLYLLAALALFLAPLTFTGCKSAPKLEAGGVYAPTNSTGQVIYNDLGLALADSTYKLAYETISSVLKYERDNRDVLWAISPNIKRTLDNVRREGVQVDRRWAEARRAYRMNPTPAGLSTLQTILSEINRLVATA